MVININVKHVALWISLAVIELMFILIAQGKWEWGDGGVPPRPAVSLTMSAQEADLVKGAVQFVGSDIDNGTITTTESACDALSANIPERVKEPVMSAVGTPPLEEFKPAMDRMVGKIKVK